METQERYKEIEKELSTLDLTKRPTLKVNIRTTDESLKLILTEFKDKKERCQKRINHLIYLEGIKTCLKQEKPKLLNEIDEYFLNSKCLKQLKENNKRYCEYLEYYEKFIADLEAVRIKLWDIKFKDIHTKYEELQQVSINNSSSVSYDSTSLESLKIAISTIEKTIKTEELNVDKIRKLNAKIESLKLELFWLDQRSFQAHKMNHFKIQKISTSKLYPIIENLLKTEKSFYSKHF